MSTGKTDLQRDILLTWYDNPNATNKEIAAACDCSASYVSEITNRFDDYTQMEAMMDRQDREMERMFGDDIFHGMGDGNGNPGNSVADGPSLVEIYSEQPDNLAGYVVRALVLVVLLFVLYQVIVILAL